MTWGEKFSANEIDDAFNELQIENGMIDAASSQYASMMTARDDDDGWTHRRSDEIGRSLLPHRESSPLVAEVVGIEERWNGVRLIEYAPFRWSRRLNGLLVTFACYFSCGL